jgi:hypothetical protein
VPVIETPRPTAVGFASAEQNLLDGVQRGAKDCQPVRGSDVLPKDALAGIECDSTDPAVARVAFFQFANDDDMLNAYLSRMKAQGVELESGSCYEGKGEHAYVPGKGLVLDRAGCFIGDDGFANYRLTMPGKHVYIGVLGQSADVVALETFVWQQPNQDTPGIPTLWFGGID